MQHSQNVILLMLSSLKNVIYPSRQALHYFFFLPVTHICIPVVQKIFNTKIDIHPFPPFSFTNILKDHKFSPANIFFGMYLCICCRICLISEFLKEIHDFVQFKHQEYYP